MEVKNLDWIMERMDFVEACYVSKHWGYENFDQIMLRK